MITKGQISIVELFDSLPAGSKLVRVERDERSEPIAMTSKGTVHECRPVVTITIALPAYQVIAP
jgi:hypothetical protein